MTATYLTITDVDDEIARRAVEAGARVADPFDEFTGLTKLSRTMDERMESSAIDLLDGPMVLGYFDHDDDDGFNADHDFGHCPGAITFAEYRA